MSLVKYIIAISTGIFLRSTISLHSYSGENNPPMYGDFEAQRHWQEVTVNLPIKDWYENTTDNDLLYWGLDYPPLTAYHSFLIGHFAKYVNESYVALHTSRGITTDDHKFFMRNTVLISDILIYIPAMLLACHVIFSKLLKMNMEKSESFYWLYVLIAISYPGQLLIDNGHFQYNNMSLGLAVLAVSAILINKRIIGAILFVLSLNYKQMELYHAVPFFCYLLSNCFVESESQRRQSVISGVSHLFKLGIVVIATFVIIWSPWLFSLSSFLQVIHRIFPIYRGVFEDKVSNVWCIVNVFMKIKDNFTNEEMAKICLGCTATALVPSSITLLFNPKKKQFLYALINSSLAFFLFSFQVHEKSILIAAIPVILIFPLEPFMSFWFLQVSTFSMIPLLAKDNLISAYIGLSGMFFLMTKIIIDNARNKKQEDMNFLQILYNINFNKSKKWIERLLIGCYVLSTIVQLVLFLGYFFLTPPEKLPFLHSLLISAFSCSHFLFFLFYFNCKQLLMN
ncbi:probable dolichyl pyrophosphate Man9GlcNAc2 alpha-1,3-glucosyltransferase [Chironomus tepperi]|uniref:probable dolichyl pyrophosphate Man9GlcNAc2 alpha-1,3-glucosyltransferase n=1 Tax=Chironomus tepperi TaxID=113505 RepID=UPI00391EEC1B